jgi:hypothetical protein
LRTAVLAASLSIWQNLAGAGPPAATTQPWGAPDVDVDDGQADQLVKLGEVGDVPPLVPNQPLEDVHCRMSKLGNVYCISAFLGCIPPLVPAQPLGDVPAGVD